MILCSCTSSNPNEDSAFSYYADIHNGIDYIISPEAYATINFLSEPYAGANSWHYMDNIHYDLSDVFTNLKAMSFSKKDDDYKPESFKAIMNFRAENTLYLFLSFTETFSEMSYSLSSKNKLSISKARNLTAIYSIEPEQGRGLYESVVNEYRAVKSLPST